MVRGFICVVARLLLKEKERTGSSDALEQLRVQALASSPSRPLKNIVPRSGGSRNAQLFRAANTFLNFKVALRIFIETLFGRQDPSARIDFQFDYAAFEVRLLSVKWK